jgi:hypothetical protein
MVTVEQLTRLGYDINGNTRYAIHFFALLSQEEINSFGLDTHEYLYNLAIKRANKLGGRKYHNKKYGGGLVFQECSANILVQHINEFRERNNLTSTTDEI